MKKYLLVLAMVISSAVAFAVPSLNDVKAQIAAGNLKQAEVLAQEVIKEVPDKPMPHYILAQILAKEGAIDDAKIQLQSAKEHGLTFKTPDEQRHARYFENWLNGQHAVAPGTPRHDIGIWDFFVGLVVFSFAMVALIAFIRAIMDDFDRKGRDQEVHIHNYGSPVTTPSMAPVASPSQATRPQYNANGTLHYYNDQPVTAPNGSKSSGTNDRCH